MMCFDLAFLIIGLIPSSFFFLFLRGEFICSSRFYSPIIRKGLTALRCLEFTTNWFFSFFNLLHQVLPLNIATDLPQARHICWGTVPWIKHDIFFLVLSSLACFPSPVPPSRVSYAVLVSSNTPVIRMMRVNAFAERQSRDGLHTSSFANTQVLARSHSL